MVHWGTRKTHRTGKDSERLFLAAFEEERWIKPRWYQSIRCATAAEDADGYDFFVCTDRGEVPIQVKSSNRYIVAYRQRHPNSTAIIIVVGLSHTAAQIRRDTLEAIGNRWNARPELLSTGAWSVPARGFDG